MQQASRNVGRGEEADAGGLGSKDKEAGGEAVCCGEVVKRCGRCSEMHGNVQHELLPRLVVYATQNITAFLMGQNQQFEDVIQALKVAKDALDPARQVLVLEPHDRNMNRPQIA